MLDLPDRTIKMLRVLPPHELPTAEIPMWEEEDIVEPIDRHDEYDDDYYIEGKPGGFKDRQIQYMTAAVVWFLVLSVLLVAGSLVWKLCLAIAS